MIQITADTRRAVVTNKELLTTGSAGIQVQFTLSEDWAGLAKVAVFRQGDEGEKVDCELGSGLTCVVPHEVLTTADEVVFCGIYGSNGQGTIIIPTIWASLGVVRPGTEPNTPATATPTPEIWAQILNVAQDAEATADEAMSLVETGLNDLAVLEAMVESAEASRVSAEQSRVTAENQRASTENSRVSAENTRVTNENARDSAETARNTAEQSRAAAENVRASAETARVSAEQERVAAEQYREEKYAEYVETVSEYADNASASATAAAGSASDAATAAGAANTSAGQAASSATAAATSASQASGSAANAGSSASTATGAANTATAQAEIATTRASEAAASATAAAESATSAANAQTAAETAQDAAETAQAAAEDAAASVSASAAQIAQNTSDISDLTRQISDVEENQIPDLKSAINSRVPLVSGTYDTNGNIVSQATRGASIFRYDVEEYQSITFPEGYEGRFFGFTQDGRYKTNSDFASYVSLENIIANEPIRFVTFVVRSATDTSADISADLDTISNGIVLERYARQTYEKLSSFIKAGVLFESGSFAADGVAKVVNVTRIRTAEPIDLSKVAGLVMPTGYELSAYLLTEDKVKISQTVYLSSITFLDEQPDAKFANVFVRKIATPSGNISTDVHIVNDKTQIVLVDNSPIKLVTLPFSGFTPDLSIFKGQDGYTTDFVPQSKYIRIANGITVFMATDGDDSNDGLTVLTPKKTLEAALSVTNVQTIIVLEGNYSAGTHYTAGRRVTQPINIVGLGNVIFDNGNGAPITFARDTYCENIHFKHGNDNTVIWDAYTENSIAVFYNCEFSDSVTLNGIRLLGGIAYVVDCICHDNAYDGFNYHNKNTWANKTVEIGCKSYNNGKIDLDVAEGNTSNATTIHGDCIIVRVNGDYKACHGAIVADQGKYSANYGCRAGLSTITDSTYDDRKSNYWATQTVEMWLYDCDSYGSKYDTYHVSTAALHSNRIYPNMV